MHWSIGIRLGFNTIEIAAQNNGDAPIVKRFFKTLTAPEQPIKDFLAEYKIQSIEQVRILTSSVLEALEYRLGGGFSVLTTQGFENWLYLSTPLENNFISVTSRRPGSFIDKNLIFSIDERTMASGEVKKTITESDLEFLVAKLKMNNINKVALCFLHSDKNSKNEKFAANYLRKHEFEVFLSSDVDCDDEVPRFWSAVINAYTRSYLVERLQAIKTLVDPFLIPGSGKISIGAYTAEEVLSGHVTPLKTAFAKTDLLRNSFAKNTPLLYFGAESFIYVPENSKKTSEWETKWGPIACEYSPFEFLPIQPLCLLDRGPLSILTVSEKEMRYDPGPIIFGRGLQPAFLDLLAYNNSLTGVNGFSAKISEKGKLRFKEYLDAFCKEMSMRMQQTVQAEELCNSLLKTALQKIALSVYRQAGTKPIRVAGALSTVLVPLLKKINPQLNFEIWTDEFFLTISLLQKSENKT